MSSVGCNSAHELFNDPAAVAVLRNRLLRTALRNLSEADAEDATQETLLALYSDCGRYRGTAQIGTYAHAILRHKTVDLYRAHGREVSYAPEALQAAIDHASESADAAPANDPAERIDAQRWTEWFWKTLAASLRELPEKTRVMFEWRELLELELPVVCRHLGVTCNHGGVLAHRARAHIRRCWPAPAKRARPPALFVP